MRDREKGRGEELKLLPLNECFFRDNWGKKIFEIEALALSVFFWGLCFRIKIRIVIALASRIIFIKLE